MAFVLIRASGIPFATHQAMVRSTACWFVAVQTAAVFPAARAMMSSENKMGSTWSTRGTGVARGPCLGGLPGQADLGFGSV